MKSPNEQVACADPVFERSLLPQDGVARWRGTPIGWIEASPHMVEANLTTEQDRLVMIDSGCTQADFRYGNRSMSWEFRPGSIGIFRAGTELQLSRWRWTHTRRIYLDLGAVLPGRTAMFEPWRPLPHRTEIEFRDPDLTAVLRTMVAEAASGSPNGQLYAESLSLGVAMRLYQRDASCLGSARERGKLTPAQLQQVQELVESQLGTVSMTAMAAAAGFSAAQFLRLFKNTVGCTPYQYVLGVRLERAREMVLTGHLPLALIAEKTGFSSQSHMTASFVHAFKTPPGEMRRRSRITPAKARESSRESAEANIHRTER